MNGVVVSTGKQETRGWYAYFRTKACRSSIVSLFSEREYSYPNGNGLRLCRVTETLGNDVAMSEAGQGAQDLACSYVI